MSCATGTQPLEAIMQSAPGWQSQIDNAQFEPEIDLIDGVYTRLRYGTEPIASSLHCRDCGVVTGQFHVSGCTIERCPRCGGQAIGCPTCTPPDHEDDGDVVIGCLPS